MRAARGVVWLAAACGALQSFRAQRRPLTLRRALEPSRTQRILDAVDAENDGEGAGNAGTFEGLQRLDSMWAALRSQKEAKAPPQFVRQGVGAGVGVPPEDEYDVVVLGGTLGIFVAAALQARGLRCAVVERGEVKGRAQEWNLSLDEVEALVEAGALEASDVDGATASPGPREVLRSEEGRLVASHFGSVRAGFNGAEFGKSGSGAEGLQEVWMPRVLNIGVRPAVAVARARARFERLGGAVLEKTACGGVAVDRERGCEVEVGDGGEKRKTLGARLVVDAMGNASPIARQLRFDKAASRGAAPPRPSGICCVVGTLARGYDPADNDFGDLIYTNRDSEPDRQYFWEAFPAAAAPDARTTYLFTYLDADAARRHSVQDQFEDYWRLLPLYQKHNAACFRDARPDDEEHNARLVDAAIASGDLKVDRALYGLFPTYRDSPLKSGYDRVLPVGDASGIQSPLSFGGFGALTRHLSRVADSVKEALDADALAAGDLAAINPYTPNLSATWMFQKSFVVPLDKKRPPNFVNRLMRTNYDNMRDLGDDVLRPFNQDVVQPGGLARVLALATIRDPLNIPALLYYVGPAEIAEWTFHFAAMGAYAAAHTILGKPARALANVCPPRQAFALRRLADAWEYGSGADYRH